ncbi:hypothetical protein C8F04DRAFT_1149583, partial [Mycena alexandri]
MSLARLASMPPELQLETYYNFGFSDLLTLSHVSKFWRAFVLGDRRWSTWFDMIVDPKTEESARSMLSRFQSTNMIPERTIVNLCLSTKCSVCSTDTADIFLPLLERICHECLDPEEHAVMSVSAALTTFDLSEKDVTPNIVILQSEVGTAHIKSIKLVSKSAMKALAIKKYGGASNLETHLQIRKARSQTSYDIRIAEYDAAMALRNQLVATGDLAGAAAVTLTNKKTPKTRPQMPTILKRPYAPPAYQTYSIMATNFLSVQNGVVVAQKLVYCGICVIMAEERGPHPNPMKRTGLALHEQQIHYARRDDDCQGAVDGICDACLNRFAIEVKAEWEQAKAGSSH